MVPFKCALHFSIDPAFANVTIWPALACIQVTPPSFEISMLIEVPVGSYANTEVNFNEVIDFATENVDPTTVAEVVVDERESNKSPSPMKLIFLDWDVGQYAE